MVSTTSKHDHVSPTNLRVHDGRSGDCCIVVGLHLSMHLLDLLQQISKVRRSLHDLVPLPFKHVQGLV